METGVFVFTWSNSRQRASTLIRWRHLRKVSKQPEPTPVAHPWPRGSCVSSNLLDEEDPVDDAAISDARYCHHTDHTADDDAAISGARYCYHAEHTRRHDPRSEVRACNISTRSVQYLSNIRCRILPHAPGGAISGHDLCSTRAVVGARYCLTTVVGNIETRLEH